MTNFKGKWGLYQWFEEYGSELIHPEDIEDFRNLFPNGKVFECVEDDGIYLTLRYDKKKCRARHELFRTVTKPSKKFGEKVKLKKNEKEGTITGIMWHFQRNTHMYFIKINGEKKSKRYWIEDFDF